MVSALDTGRRAPDHEFGGGHAAGSPGPPDRAGRTGRQFGGLDALRGLAVSLVVVHHAASLAGPQRSGWLATPAACLDVGVAIFFVLSGFLIYRPFAIAHATGARPTSARVFWWRRAVRILPAYWVALTFFWWAGVIRPATLGDLISHYLLLNVFRPSALFGGISQGWSLTVEVCFYAAVPGLSWLLRRRQRGRGGIVPLRDELLLVGVAMLGAHLFRIFCYSVGWHIGGAELRGISYLWLPTHMDIIAAGMAIAVIWVAREHRGETRFDGLVAVLSRRSLMAVAALVIFVAYAYGVGGPSIATGYSLAHLEIRQLAYLLIGVLLVAPLCLPERTGLAGETSRFVRSISGRAGWWAGALSYGLYLWHNDWMKLAVGEVSGFRRLPTRLGSGLGDMNIVALLAVGFGLGLFSAVISWFCIEQPTSGLRNLVSAKCPSVFASLTERQRTGVALTAIALVLLAPLAGLLHYQGPPMEEGFMLAFPMQILDGRVPHRDFLHLYGPGSLWVLAALFKTFGTSLDVERMVGLFQQAAMGFGMFALLRPWGRRIATIAAVVTVVILIGPLGLSALAWNGALAAATCGLAAICAARRRSGSGVDRTAIRLAGWAGFAAGVALLYRPDLILAVTLGFGAAVWSATPAIRRRFAIVGGVTLAAYIPHLLISGVGNSIRGMFIEPVFKLRGGRSLPLPPSWGELDGFLQRAGALRTSSWSLPMPAPSHQVFLWFFAVPGSALFVLWVAWRLRRVPEARQRSATLWPAALFGVALLTQAVQRPDTAHLSWVSGFTFAVGIAAISELGPIRRLSPERRAWAASLPVLVMLIAVIPFYPLRTYVDLVGQSAGYGRFGYEIRRDDRVFYFGDRDGAAAAQQVTDALAAQSRPGEKLIVGPIDLSKTPYSDAFFYYLFPELRVGTRYIEMDPGIADGADSGLADELRNADWLIQSDAWSDWNEPNDSVNAGSPEPNQVVADHYCPVVDAGEFRLLHRCR